MSLGDILDEYVSNKIFRRGKNYYHEGRIFDYHVQPLEDNNYRLTARVRGTSDYRINIELQVKGDNLYFDNSCTCPYDWGPVCKHEVAVLYKFLEEDFYRTNSVNDSDNTNFAQLEELSSRLSSSQPASLQYRIKGLATDTLVNFKLILSSDRLSEERLDQLTAYIHNSYLYRRMDDILEPLTEQDIVNLEYLKNAETTASRTPGAVLFPKNRPNFNFLLQLMEKNEVYLAETGLQARKGEELYPDLIIKGDLDKIEIETEDFEEQLYWSSKIEGQGFCWTVIDSAVHPVRLDDLAGLPANIPIPEEKQGEFLFEILPALQERLDLKLDDNLQGYQLQTKKPEIKLEFDYQNQTILCRSKIAMAGEVYQNTEILGFDPDDKRYSPVEGEAKVWATWDTEPVGKLFDFLEEYGFHVSPQAFTLRDESGIQRFITTGLDKIPEEWEVETTASFADLEVKPVVLEPIIDFGTEKGKTEEGRIDWFEFKVTYNLGGKTYSRSELQELLRYNDQGQKYLRQGNRYFLLEETPREEQVENLLKTAEQQEDNSYRSRRHNLLYYRNLIKQEGIDFKGNRVYNELDQDITEDGLVTEADIPEEVEHILREYQKQGYYWLRFLNRYRFGGILADDMGLGKTLQTLTLLKSLKLERPALIACPRTLIYNWAEEIDKFFSGLDYLVYYGRPAERKEMRQSFNEYEILITSYSIISRDYQELQDTSFSYVILDEAHHIKNRRTNKAQGVKQLKSEHRLALTGTPLENSLEELWSIFDFLMPGYLKSYKEFRRNYLNPIEKENNQQQLAELKERIAPFILRRKKEEVLTELPDKIINLQSVQMTKVQEDTYRLILSQVKDELVTKVEEQGFNRSRINILAALTKLRQICDHPQLVLEDTDKGLTSGKLDLLLELVQDAVAGGHKVVVFSQFVKMLKLIRQRLEKKGLQFEYLDGSTTNRMERVKRFNQSDEIEAFLISLRAGGTGLNLTAADIVIHVDPWWNPMVERQATDRVHRIGQDKEVIVYKLITTGTVEEKMLQLKQKKEDIFENVIERNDSPLAEITWQDIQDLLEY